MELDQINTFVLNRCKLDWLAELTWKTLNKVDRSSLSDTDERVVVMLKLKMMNLGGVQEYSIERVDNRTEIE